MESSYVAIQPRDGNASLATTIAIQQAQAIVHNQGFMITSEDQLRREKRRQKKWTVLIAIVGLIGFFVALAAIIVEASTISYLAFAFPIVLGPYAIHQRRKLNKLPTLVFVMNQIRDQINRLMIENTKLYNENSRLEGQIQRLQDSETKLEAVVQKSGHDVDTICTLVKENAETQRQMKVWYFILAFIHFMHPCIERFSFISINDLLM
jgi:cell division protein FtsB